MPQPQRFWCNAGRWMNPSCESGRDDHRDQFHNLLKTPIRQTCPSCDAMFGGAGGALVYLSGDVLIKLMYDFTTLSASGMPSIVIVNRRFILHQAGVNRNQSQQSAVMSLRNSGIDDRLFNWQGSAMPPCDDQLLPAGSVLRVTPAAQGSSLVAKVLTLDDTVALTEVWLRLTMRSAMLLSVRMIDGMLAGPAAQLPSNVKSESRIDHASVAEVSKDTRVSQPTDPPKPAHFKVDPSPSIRAHEMLPARANETAYKQTALAAVAVTVSSRDAVEPVVQYDTDELMDDATNDLMSNCSTSSNDSNSSVTVEGPRQGHVHSSLKVTATSMSSLGLSHMQPNNSATKQIKGTLHRFLLLVCVVVLAVCNKSYFIDASGDPYMCDVTYSHELQQVEVERNATGFSRSSDDLRPYRTGDCTDSRIHTFTPQERDLELGASILVVIALAVICFRVQSLQDTSFGQFAPRKRRVDDRDDRAEANAVSCVIICLAMCSAVFITSFIPSDLRGVSAAAGSNIAGTPGLAGAMGHDPGCAFVRKMVSDGSTSRFTLLTIQRDGNSKLTPALYALIKEVNNPACNKVIVSEGQGSIDAGVFVVAIVGGFDMGKSHTMNSLVSLARQGSKSEIASGLNINSRRTIFAETEISAPLPLESEDRFECVAVPRVVNSTLAGLWLFVDTPGRSRRFVSRVADALIQQLGGTTIHLVRAVRLFEPLQSARGVFKQPMTSRAVVVYADWYSNGQARAVIQQKHREMMTVVVEKHSASQVETINGSRFGQLYDTGDAFFISHALYPSPAAYVADVSALWSHLSSLASHHTNVMPAIWLQSLESAMRLMVTDAHTQLTEELAEFDDYLQLSMHRCVSEFHRARQPYQNGSVSVNITISAIDRGEVPHTVNVTAALGSLRSTFFDCMDHAAPRSYRKYMRDSDLATVLQLARNVVDKVQDLVSAHLNWLHRIRVCTVERLAAIDSADPLVVPGSTRAWQEACKHVRHQLVCHLRSKPLVVQCIRNDGSEQVSDKKLYAEQWVRCHEEHTTSRKGGFFCTMTSFPSGLNSVTRMELPDQPEMVKAHVIAEAERMVQEAMQSETLLKRTLKEANKSEKVALDDPRMPKLYSTERQMHDDAVGSEAGVTRRDRRDAEADRDEL